MTDTLRELDEEIARARGWVYRTWNGRGERWMEAETPIAKTDAMRLDCPCDCSDQEHDGCCNPPPFSSSWALAGPLLEEMAESGRSEGNEAGVVFVGWPPRWCAAPSGIGMATTDSDYSPGDEAAYAHDGGGPCEAIARAWLAWHRSKI